MSLVILPPKGKDGRTFAVEKPDSSKATIVTHDWTDKTTWYQGAVRVVDEIADCTDPGTYTQYEVDNDFIIDTYHGKLSQEDFLKDAQGNSYRAVVKVNDVTKTEQNPHTGSGGDYTINYETGVITFLSALVAEDEVEVTYHYATNGTFTIKPAAGKVLVIDKVEVQFATDVVLTDTVKFQPYGLVDVFAPQLVPTPFPSGTLIPLGDPLVYKTFRDYMNDAHRSYPDYGAMGGAGWRGLNVTTRVFVWDYIRATSLRSSYGMEIRIEMENNVPFEGSFGTATLYCASEDEP